jgi:hypothetical protein
MLVKNLGCAMGIDMLVKNLGCAMSCRLLAKNLGCAIPILSGFEHRFGWQSSLFGFEPKFG